MFGYKNNSTIFHRLPIITKSWLSIVFLVFLFLMSNLKIIILMFLIVVMLLCLSKYGLYDFFKLIKALLFFSIVPLAILFFFIQPPLQKFLLVILRLYTLMLFMTFLTSTTDAYNVLKFMKRAKFPRVIYLSTYIMLRFFPEIEYEYKELIQVLKLRNIFIKWNSIKSWMNYLRYFFVQMIFILLKRAEEISIALYLRENDFD